MKQNRPTAKERRDTQAFGEFVAHRIRRDAERPETELVIEDNDGGSYAMFAPKDGPEQRAEERN